jgi:P-type conjugative transfer protein TrbJ
MRRNQRRLVFGGAVLAFIAGTVPFWISYLRPEQRPLVWEVGLCAAVLVAVATYGWMLVDMVSAARRALKDMRHKRLAFVPALLLLMGVSQQKADAQFVVVDPTLNSTTLLMKAEQVLQYIQEAGTALNTYNHLQLMIREVQQLVAHPSTNIAYDLATFSSVLQQSQALAMNLAQMDAVFQNNFAPFAPSPLVNYAAQYNTWATTALNGLHSAANSAAAQGGMIQNEQLFMGQMNTMNQGDNGMDQSIQLGNSIGLETVAQLERLRMLTIANIQQNAVMATTVLNTQQAEITTMTNMYTDLGVTADQRGW